MATVTAYTPFNMDAYAILYGTELGQSPSGFQVSNPPQWQNYSGHDFTYVFGANQSGVLNTTELYLNFVLQYSVTGLDHSMMTVNDYRAFNDPQGLLGFLLSGDDTFTGSSGNDFAKGYAGNDFLDGGNGNDTLDGGPGADALAGGTGIDTYMVDDPGDIVSEAPGLAFPDGDTIIASLAYVLPPTMENLVLAGSAAINGTGNGFGNAMTGNGANNVLDAAAGNDTLDGGDGDDTLIGGSGDDQLNGGNGNDWAAYADAPGALQVGLDIATTQNTLGAGMDALASIENLIGGSFNDMLTGNAAANVLNGALGDDSLNGGDGNDTLIAGEGDDTLLGGAGDDQLSGAGGIDWASYANAAGAVTVAVGLAMAQHTLGAGMDMLADIENLIGSPYDDTLAGNSVANVVNGGAGDDSMEGRAANDTLSGTTGNDTLDGGIGADVLDGGEGHDVLNGSTGNDTLIGTDGNDTLDGGVGIDQLTGGAGDDVYVVNENSETVVELANEGIDTVQSSVAAVLAQNVENLLLTGADDIGGRGNALANVVTGNNGANMLRGGGGDDLLQGAGRADTLSGGTARDTLSGGNAGDWLNGGGAADIMEGGAGNDTYVVERGTDVVLEQAGEGNFDTIRSSVSFQLAANVELLVLTGSLGIRGIGNGLDNTLTGNSGGNVLIGGAGNDSLTGGQGQDSFVFDSALDATTNVDTIADFSAADDLIRLDDDVFAALATGSLPERAWYSGAGVTTAHDQTDRVLYDNSTGNLYYDPDGTGAQAATIFATLVNTPAITIADFFIVA